MAYIETHQALLTHRKTLRLSRLIGIDRWGVAGRLMALWSWALDNAPDGAIAHEDSDILADVMGWDGEPSELCHALVTAGFLDQHANHYAIHDWMDYAGRLIEKRKSDAERKRQARASSGHTPPVQRTSGGHPADGAGTLPNPTLPNPTRERENVPAERGASAPPVDASEPETPSTNGHKPALPPRRKSETTEAAYYERVLKDAASAERIPLLVFLAHDKIGADNTPGCESYARLGMLARKHGAALVAKWILQAATEHIAGDPLDYLTALAKKQTNRASQNGHNRATTAATREPVYATADQAAPKGWE